MNRLNDNLEILKIIEQFLINNPDLRFMQALNVLDLLSTHGESRFYEESSKTVKRLKKCNL